MVWRSKLGSCPSIDIALFYQIITDAIPAILLLKEFRMLHSHCNRCMNIIYTLSNAYFNSYSLYQCSDSGLLWNRISGQSKGEIYKILGAIIVSYIEDISIYTCSSNRLLHVDIF